MVQDNWMSTGKRVKVGTHFTLCTKTNSTRIRDLNRKAKPTELLEENTGVNLHDVGLDNGFLAQTTKGKK